MSSSSPNAMSDPAPNPLEPAPPHAVSLVSAGSAEPYRRLAEVFHDVLSEESPTALLERIADTLAELMPYEAVHIYEADETKRELRPVLARSEWEEEIMNASLLLRRGHHRLGGRASRARPLEHGAPRSPRPLRPRHARRAGGADRRAADRARPAQGRAQHLPRRRGRPVHRGGVPARDAVRGRRGARHRQRAHPRAARAPGLDGRAHRPLQPPHLPRPPPRGADARVGRARHRRPRDARPRRLQEGQRRVRPRRRRPAAAPGRRRAARLRPRVGRRLPGRRRGVRGHHAVGRPPERGRRSRSASGWSSGSSRRTRPGR